LIQKKEAEKANSYLGHAQAGDTPLGVRKSSVIMNEQKKEVRNAYRRVLSINSSISISAVW
jgi:hypothetical protein